MVSIEDCIKGFNMIMDGEVDHLPKMHSLMWGLLKMPSKRANESCSNDESTGISADNIT